MQAQAIGDVVVDGAGEGIGTLKHHPHPTSQLRIGHAAALHIDTAQQHLAEVDRKIEELTAMRATLSELVRACAGDERPDCPILRDLAAPS